MRWFPIAFLISGVLKVTHGGIKLGFCMLNHYATAPLVMYKYAEIELFRYGVLKYIERDLFIKRVEKRTVHKTASMQILKLSIDLRFTIFLISVSAPWHGGYCRCSNPQHQSGKLNICCSTAFKCTNKRTNELRIFILNESLQLLD